MQNNEPKTSENNLKEAISLFIAEKQKSRSFRTIESYSAVLSDFYEFCAKTQKTDDIGDLLRKSDILSDFINYKENTAKTLKNSTKGYYGQIIKIFIGFIAEQSGIEFAMPNLPSEYKIGSAKRQPKGLSAIEIDRLEGYFNSISDRYKHKPYPFLTARNSLLVKLALYAGLRCSEIISLKTSDIEPLEDNRLYAIKVIGKGNKERYSYIKREMIERELSSLQSLGKTSIAVTKDNKPMKRCEVWRSVSVVLKRAGVDRSGVHQLRHTFAQRLVSKDINLVTIKELLGHSDIKTTMIYVKSNERAKAIACLK